MIDYFALTLTHGLILIALIRLVSQKALDEDPQLENKRKRPRGPGREPARDLEAEPHRKAPPGA